MHLIKFIAGLYLDPFPYKENKNSDFHQEIEITMREENNLFGDIPNQNILPNNIREEYTMPKIGIKVDMKLMEFDIVNVDFLYHLVDFENNTESSPSQIYNHLPIY